MSKRVEAFVPLKLQSRRLPNKNFLRLGDRPLAYHVFDVLAGIEEISRIHCYTSQPQILSLLPERIELLSRPVALDGDTVKANELFRYAVENIQADIIVLCHATSPYIGRDSIRKGIEAVKSGEYDCAFAVQKHQTYCWHDGKPLNYNPEDMAQTQALKPVYTETSGFYIFNREAYLQKGTRIGDKPFMVEISMREAIDIDHPEDFALARTLLDFDPKQMDFAKDNFFVSLAAQGFDYAMVNHLAFDLDGVLIDSLPVMEKAWKAVQSEMGISIPFSSYRQHIGLPFFDILIKIGIPTAQHAEVKRIYNDVSLKHHQEIQVYPGVRESLVRAKAAGFAISIVTSKSRERTQDILRHQLAGIDFDAVMTCDDVVAGRGKPHPDSLLKACIDVGEDPVSSVYIGDMESDLQTANRAGVHFMHAAWGIGNITNVRNIWFNSITDLVDFMTEYKTSQAA